MRFAFASLLLGMAALMPAKAQTTATTPILQVSATAEVRVTPDAAMVSAGVTSMAPSARDAMSDNSRQMNAVIDALRKAGIDAKDIQTSGLNLNPQYRYKENEPPVITGYQASNMVNVRMRKLDTVGTVLDTLVAKGANQINGPTFLVSNEDGALDVARKEAVVKARSRAELYAAAAGVKLKRILAISEGGGYAQPIPNVAVQMARAAPMDTPVAPGQSVLSVTVNLSYEIEALK